ncbi:CHASE2 domain-containing protein [Geobacter sp. SVR]|uniref:CHASE2 domain-containing protein n=1 Tax=Geobacter sp. SVR TaxID=2495594 RepID=UPI00143EF7B9|nr:CHASE2 domain-containing protein [Geobacter sp. SVR]BCS52193.1 hypothetical protein GSVR_05010 [Geobacter sp. SVR]GCF85145.1 hypothetical protein GSbR_17450 [Geobacter sp. SVR]
MGIEWRKIHGLLIVCAGLLLLFIDFLGLFEGINSFLFDLSFRIRGGRPTDSRIVIAAIDERSLETLGRWPIRRSWYADLLDRTRKAAVVGFDIIMAEPTADDALLAEAIRRHTRVVLPVYVSAGRLAVIHPAGAFAPAGTGHVHIEPGIDGIVRKLFHSLYFDNASLPSLASVMYELARSTKDGWRPHYPGRGLPAPAGTIVQGDPMGINYYGGPHSFRYVSLADVVAGAYPQSFFRDKIVLVGVTAAGLKDEVLTPFSRQRNRMPSVELQATVLNNLLDGNGIRDIPGWINAVLAMALFGICFALTGGETDRRIISLWLGGLVLVTLAFFCSFSLWDLRGAPALSYASVTVACLMSYLFRLDVLARKLDREYAVVASHLNVSPVSTGRPVPQTGLPGCISPKGLNEKIEMLVMLVEELLKTHSRLDRETTERIEAMGELRQKEQMLIQQSRMAAMGEMLNNIAHQWRQPLNVLGLALQQVGLFYEYGKLDKELLDANIAKAMKILLHLSQTIDDFRNFSTPDKEKSLFRVDQVIARTVSLIEESFRNQNITIEMRVIGEPCINGYPNEFGQVILNILMNARDAFLERGTRNARVEVCSRTEHGKTVVTIADNAGGISEEIMGSIFDAYFTTKELGKGTGVGLFMSKTIIEKNIGGRLTARNTGEGVEFRIEA